jgi:hypothetical protein
VKHGEEFFAVVISVKTPSLRFSKTALIQLSDTILERDYCYKIIKTEATSEGITKRRFLKKKDLCVFRSLVPFRRIIPIFTFAKDPFRCWREKIPESPLTG